MNSERVAVASATLYGLTAALTSAALGFLCWNFFFIPPLYGLSVHEPRDVVAILVFGGVSVSTGLMASRLREGARSAQSRIEGLRQVGAFSRALDVYAVLVSSGKEISLYPALLFVAMHGIRNDHRVEVTEMRQTVGVVDGSCDVESVQRIIFHFSLNGFWSEVADLVVTLDPPATAGGTDLTTYA